VSFAIVVRDELLSVEAAVRAPQRILDLLGMALYAVDAEGGVLELFGRI
jgi:2-methylcitrate dehydratase PrpD